MPWSPSFANVVPDPRLDPYRGRAARLLDGDDVVGHVLVETDYSAESLGGVLWWRRWAVPVEFAIVFTQIGEAEARTTGVGTGDLDIFNRWAEVGYDDAGRRLSAVWLDESESQRVHDEVFAHEH